MEKGKLIVQATKKGFMGKIQFTKSDGKNAELPISVVRFTDNKDNGKECEFERDGGKLTKLVVEGKTLHPIVEEKKSSHKTHQKQDKYSNNQRQENTNSVDDSMLIQATFLPKDTQDALLESNTTEIANFMLKLHKIARFDDKREVFTFFKRERKGDNYQIKTDYQDFKFKELVDRQKRNAKAQSITELIELESKIDWHMALGLGIDSVYETGITLHHIYGIPYIPATAVKGVVRSWIITQFFSEHNEKEERIAFDLKKAEERALKNQKFCDFFGCDNASYYKEARQGHLIFFDAFPTSVPSIEPDVMNSHYQPYYSELPINAKTPPADYHNPIPVFFLTVKDCCFQFLVGLRVEKEYLKEEKEENKVKIFNLKIGDKNIKKWLKDALENHGIGAKTAVGYGYMQQSQ